MKQRPISYKKKVNRKRIDLSRVGSASQAIGELEHNTDIFCLTFGQFSLIEALVAILDKTGPAHVAISTWTAATANLDQSMELMEAASILSLKMIVDVSFPNRQPEYYKHMLKLFGSSCVRRIHTHAKFIIVYNDEWNVVIRTSMNLNQNRRLENIEVTDNKEFCDFFKKIVKSTFDEMEEGEENWFGFDKNPQLSLLPENTNFSSIQCNHIPINKLKEVSYTHQIGENFDITKKP